MSILRNNISRYVLAIGMNDGGETAVEINLYQDFKKTANHIAVLSFVEGGTGSVTWPEVGTIGEPVRVGYPMSAYEKVLDLLRNERPLTLVSIREWNSVNIQSGREAVGEEES